MKLQKYELDDICTRYVKIKNQGICKNEIGVTQGSMIERLKDICDQIFRVNNNDLASCLKGKDAIIYHVAKSLGLNIDMKPVLSRYDECHWNNTVAVAKQFIPFFDGKLCKKEAINEKVPLLKLFGDISFEHTSITWCHDQQQSI